MSRKIASIAAAVLLLATFAILPAGSGHTASLDKDSCNKLKTEQDGLEKGGIRATMAKGPEWAKANLPPDKLDEIKRAIELDEQLLFRCAGKPLVVLPPESDPAAPPPADDKDSKPEGEKKAANPDAPAAPGPPQMKTPPAQKKAAPQRKAAVQQDKVKSDADAGKAGGDDPQAKAPAKPQAKAKPKVKAKPKEDAYKAPAPDGANPLGLD